MRNKNIIFDFFGTLVSDQQILEKGKALKEKLSEPQQNIFLAIWRYWHMKNMTQKEFIELVEKTNMFNDKEIGFINERIALDKFEVFDDVLDSLEKLKLCGYNMAILTNTPPINMVQIARETGFADFIQNYYLSCELGCMKPEKVIFEKVISDLGWSASNTIYIGDGYLNDFLGPRNAGFNAILLDRRNIYHIEPRIDSLVNLPEILNKIFR